MMHPEILTADAEALKPRRIEINAGPSQLIEGEKAA